jgi:uncharacterized coiled-coil DUF342 family protein
MDVRSVSILSYSETDICWIQIIQDIDSIKTTAKELKAEAEENRKSMVTLTESVQTNKGNIKVVEDRTDVMRDEIDKLHSKISEINELRNLITVR